MVKKPIKDYALLLEELHLTFYEFTLNDDSANDHESANCVTILATLRKFLTFWVAL